MKNLKDIAQLHFEHQVWRKELAFFEDELKSFENRLAELVVASHDHDMLAGLEQFQNQFIRQKEVIDQLDRDIRVHEQHLSKLALKDMEAAPSDNGLHDRMREDMNQFRKIYGELKTEFFKFMTHWRKAEG